MTNTNPLKLRVAVVGLGLMGGSLAAALKPHVSLLTAVDTNQDSLDAALTAGVIDRGTADLAEGLSGAELIILATPVKTILDILRQLPELCPAGCLVFDLGSTKGKVCSAMAKLPPAFQAIGGHPMCGKESSGFPQADPDLYQNQTFVLCRTARTTPLVEQIALTIVEVAGGRPLFLPPLLHDDLVSMTSHLPYLVSAVLMRQAAEQAQEQADLWTVSASGFRDSSRLSGSDPQVMGDILLTNRTAVLTRLRQYSHLLDNLIATLETEADVELVAWLEETQGSYKTYRKYMDST
ncbi:MAG: prephenate dehydrogenase [Candidatus Promineifilaceae bacterium]